MRYVDTVLAVRRTICDADQLDRPHRHGRVSTARRVGRRPDTVPRPRATSGRRPQTSYLGRTQSLGLAPAPSASHQLPRPHTSFLGLAPGTLASNQVPRPETQSLGLTLATLGLAPCPSASPNSTTATLESLPLQVWILNADFTRYSTL